MKNLPHQLLSMAARTAFIGIAIVASAHGANTPTPLLLSTEPLFFGGGVQPSIFITLDDSSSMEWSFMPDSLIAGGQTAKWGLSTALNYLAYNPFKTYGAPISDASGAPQNAAFDAAWEDGYAAYLSGSNYPATCKVDLNTAYRPTWGSSDGNSCDLVAGADEYHAEAYVGGVLVDGSTVQQRAFFYLYSGGNAGCSGDPYDDACYTQYTVPDARLTAISEAEQKLNFANWYSYYRKRIYVEKAASLTAVQPLGPKARVGLGRLNADGTIVKPVGFLESILGDVLGGIVKTGLNNDVGGWYQPAFSPGYSDLRRAADEVGTYFQTAQPWADNLSSGGGLSCRRAYHLMFSDGYWDDGDGTDNAGANSPANENNDGEARFDTISGPDPYDPLGVRQITYKYEPTTPFKDGRKNTLADVAMYYWGTDLQEDKTNNVPATQKDPAFWQHLTTISVGLGLGDGQVDPDAAFDAIFSKATITWPPLPPADQTAEIPPLDPATLDDFLHAAINSRGVFLNMEDADAFPDLLSGLLSSIPGRAASAASAVLNSGALRSDTRIYQARFSSSNWTGQLLAYSINSDGTVGTFLWDAGTKIPSPGNRNIWTYSGGSSRGFTSSNSSVIFPQPSVCGSTTDAFCKQLIEYVRGVEPGNTSNGVTVPSTWRPRSGWLLGDIVNSAPAYAGLPSMLYPDIGGWSGTNAPENAAGAERYPMFRENAIQGARPDMIYVGANAGVLHAFDADSGAEKFAFVPNSVLAKLTRLKEKVNFVHQYLVDGSPTVGDAFFGGKWHTVLVAGLGGGGQGIFALDITDPNNIKVLWEFTDDNNRNLGFTFGAPNIVRIGTRWYALFGNGLNNITTPSEDPQSQKGVAALIAVDLEEGPSATMTWGTNPADGYADDPLKSSRLLRPNGIVGAAPIDVVRPDPEQANTMIGGRDFTADYVYAGDLFGNLWRFNLNSNGSGTKVFSAISASGKPQAITTRPSVIRHPSGAGFIIVFGTGKYLEQADNSQDPATQFTQTVYGIWDNPDVNNWSVSRDKLQQQQILAEVVVDRPSPEKDYEYRLTTDNSFYWYSTDNPNGMRGWFLDLIDPDDNKHHGERVVSDVLVRNSKLIFTTLIPSSNPCEFGGTGWLMELDAATGARLAYSPFDVNNDGTFSTFDYIATTSPITGKEITAPPSGRRSTVGIVPSPAILARQGGEREYKYLSGSTGNLEVVVEKSGAEEDVGRVWWNQLFRDE
jgi:type IV pilus assembly protein PilY1